MLIEVEGVINARPLTYIYDDSEGVSYLFTASHMIYRRCITVLPNEEHFEIVSTNKSLTKRAKHHRQILQHFISQWKHEYLTGLRENAKVKNRSVEPNIGVGDVVILKGEGTARCFCKMAKVINLMPGSDGKIRADEVSVLNKDSK